MEELQADFVDIPMVAKVSAVQWILSYDPIVAERDLSKASHQAAVLHASTETATNGASNLYDEVLAI